MYVHLLTTSFFIGFTLCLLYQDHVGHAQTKGFQSHPLSDHPEIFVGAAAYTRAGPIDQQVSNQQSRKPPKPIVKPLQSPANIMKSNQKAAAESSKKRDAAPDDQDKQNPKPVTAESTVNTRVNSDDTCLVRITINDDWLHYARFRLINAFKKLIALISSSIQKRKQQHHRLHKRDTKCLWNNNIPEANSWSFDVIAKKRKKSQQLGQNSQPYQEDSFGEVKSEFL